MTAMKNIDNDISFEDALGKTFPTPVKKINVSPVHIAIWKNQNSKTNESYYSATLNRAFKTAGDFKQTNSYNLRQLKIALIAIQEAIAWMEDHEPGATS